MERTLIDSVIGNIGSEVATERGDYLGEDGLLYCGKCHTRKQRRIEIFGENKVVNILCECQKAERDRQAHEKLLEEERIRLERLKSSSLMDGRFARAKFKDYKVSEESAKVLKIATRYVENFDDMYEKNQGLLFYGKCGTGKSYTAACIANELMEKGVSVVMISFVKVMQNIRSKEFDEERFIKLVEKPSLLIIDDFGSERSTDFTIEKVYNIIDSRYRAERPMMITTNLDLQDMRKEEDVRYQRIYDRVFETCYPVKFDFKPLRIQEAARRYDDMKKFLEG